MVEVKVEEITKARTKVVQMALVRELTDQKIEEEVSIGITVQSLSLLGPKMMSSKRSLKKRQRKRLLK